MSVTPNMRTGTKLCVLSSDAGSSGRNRSTCKTEGADGLMRRLYRVWAESGAHKGWRAPCKKLLPPSARGEEERGSFQDLGVL